MRYLHVKWHQADPDYPMEIYHEIDENDNELRKIEIYSDGKIGYADDKIECGGSFLADQPIPSNEKIAAMNEFEVNVIDHEIFQRKWDELT